MARYWVGGAGNINDTAHWAATSGGAGGETVPDSTQDVFFDDNSGAGSFNVTRNAAITVASIDTSARTGNGVNFTSTGAINVEGNATLNNFTSNGGTTQLLTFKTNSGVTSVFTAGGFIETNNMTISLDAADAIVKLGSNFTVNAQKTFSIANGTFDTDGYTLKAGFITASAGETVYFRDSTIQLNASGQAGLNINSATNFDAGTSTIQVLNNSCQLILGGHTYHRFELLGGTSGNPTSFTDQGWTIDYLFVETPTTAIVGVEFEPSATAGNITTLEAIGTSSFPITFTYLTPGSAGTYALCITNTLMSYCDIEYMDASCGNPVVNPNGTDSGNNTNVLFNHWWEGIPGAHYKKPQMEDVLVAKAQLQKIGDSKPKGESISDQNAYIIGIGTRKPQASIVKGLRPLLA